MSARQERPIKALWKMLAFASRYGHQSLDTLCRMPLPALHDFCNALAELITEERGDPWRESAADGG